MVARRCVPMLAAAVLARAACGTPSAFSAADLQATVDAQVQATLAAQVAAAPTATSVLPTNTPEAPTDTPEPPTDTPVPPTVTNSSM